jgi:hypothetical protein
MEAVASDSEVFFRDDDCLDFCLFGSGGLESDVSLSHENGWCDELTCR